MADEKWQELDPEEGARLAQGARVLAADAGQYFGDGDILMTFALPDGRTLRYEADFESDYYGGTYHRIRWLVSAGGANG